MRRNASLQSNIKRFLRRTDIKSDQVHDKVKEFLSTSDELADQICFTVKKFLSTSDETADIVYEAIKRLFGNEHSRNPLRSKLAGLLESDDMSEDDLEFEIRRFLNAAGQKKEESRFSMKGDKAEHVVSKLQDFLKEMPRKTHKVTSKVDEFAEDTSDRIMDKLDDLFRGKRTSLESLKEGLTEILQSLEKREKEDTAHFDSAQHSDQRTTEFDSSGRDTAKNHQLAKTLDIYLHADGKLFDEYKKMDDFNQPVNAAMLLSLVKFLQNKESSHERVAEPEEEHEKQEKNNEEFMS